MIDSKVHNLTEAEWGVLTDEEKMEHDSVNHLPYPTLNPTCPQYYRTMMHAAIRGGERVRMRVLESFKGEDALEYAKLILSVITCYRTPKTRYPTKEMVDWATKNASPEFIAFALRSLYSEFLMLHHDAKINSE